MPKFNKLRTMLANGDMQWSAQSVTCAVLSGYTFDATHDTLAAIQGAGGVVLGTGKLAGKAVTVDGLAQSFAVALKLIPAGGPYDVLLVSDLATSLLPLVFYDNVITMASSGDILIRPEGSVLGGLGSWFKF